MIRHILLFAVLACNISITFTGSNQSAPPMPKIKMAKMKILKQRLNTIKHQESSEHFLKEITVLKQFSGNFFNNADEIDSHYKTICRENFEKTIQQCEWQINMSTPGYVGVKQEWISLHPQDRVYKEIESTHAAESQQIKPIILAILLKEDHPTLYAQLKDKGE